MSHSRNCLLMLLGLLALASFAASARAAPLMQWQPWQQLLQAHVKPTPGGHSTQVDYRQLARQKPQLEQLLAQAAALSQAQFDAAPREEQLAFLINLYNLATVDLVLSRYPQLSSIKDLGSLWQSPWKQERVRLFGQNLSLDAIEHQWIRQSGRYREPRIHFAVNCASIGCPALREEAYSAERLDAQLDAQTRRFLADRSRNRLEPGHLALSSIFKWYRDDFEQGWGGVHSLAEFIARYAQPLGLDTRARDALLRGELRLEFLPYDWGLNDLRPNP
jgi:hypothetical protein